MDYPGYQKGFAFLRDVGIDQHVVARERLPDLADSIMPKYPEPARHLGGRGHGVGRARRHGDDRRTQQGVRVWRQRSDRRRHAVPHAAPGRPIQSGDAPRACTARPTTRRSSRRSSIRCSRNTRIRRPAARRCSSRRTARCSSISGYGIPTQAKYMQTTTVPQFALGEIARGVHGALRAAARGTRRSRRRAAAPDSAGRGGRGAAAEQQHAVPELRDAPGLHADRHAQDDGDGRRRRAVQRRRAVSPRARARESAHVLARHDARRRERTARRRLHARLAGRHAIAAPRVSRVRRDRRQAERVRAHSRQARDDHHSHERRRGRRQGDRRSDQRSSARLRTSSQWSRSSGTSATVGLRADARRLTG